MAGRGVLIAVVVLAVTSSGCSDDDGAATTVTTATTLTTTTAEGMPTTTAPPTATTTTTSTAADTEGVPAYQIVLRQPGTGGDTVVVLIEPGTYTDLDLQNVVADAVARFAPIATLHLIDDAQAAAMVVAEEEPTAEQQEFLDQHYLLILEDGFRLTYLGPFAHFGTVVLGS